MFMEENTELTEYLVLPVKLLCSSPMSVVFLRSAFVSPAGVTYDDIGKFAALRSHTLINSNNRARVSNYVSRHANLIKDMIDANMLVSSIKLLNDKAGRPISLFQITSIGRRALHIYDNTGVTLNDFLET